MVSIISPCTESFKGQGQTIEEAGKAIYDSFRAMADHPKWLLRLVGGLKYNKRYVSRLSEAVKETQKRRYPGDWVQSLSKAMEKPSTTV